MRWGLLSLRGCRRLRGLAGRLLSLCGFGPFKYVGKGESILFIFIVFDVVKFFLESESLLSQVVVLALKKDFENAVNLVVGEIGLAKEMKDMFLNQVAQNGRVLNRVILNLIGEYCREEAIFRRLRVCCRNGNGIRAAIKNLAGKKPGCFFLNKRKFS